MKIMFLSDIHGSNFYLQKAISKFLDEKADIIVLLGDILYHGPRNSLPKEYDPKKVADTLNQYKDKIIAVRGNCDSEVDQMMLEFPILSDYVLILNEGKKVFATHGHIYNEDKNPPISKNEILIHGHTHIPVAKKVEQRYILNPGSISLPKNDYKNSYGILFNNNFEVKSLDGEIIKKINI